VYGNVGLGDIHDTAHALGAEMVEGIADHSGATSDSCGVEALLEELEVVQQDCVAAFQFYKKMSSQRIQITVPPLLQLKT
jgi:hypothetical protein